MSSFRLIFIAALTAAMVLFVIDAAAAQSATDQAGKAYLAGLRPPHEHPKAAHVKTSRAASPHKPATKSTQQTTKRQPSIAAKSTTRHRPARLAEKINSRVAWPSVAPNAADEPAASETVLQFATEDATPTSSTPASTTSASPSPLRAASATAAAARATMPTASAVKPAPPVSIAATDEHDSANPAADKRPSGGATVAQTERVEPPAPRPMRVIAPALSETPIAAAPPSDQPPTRSSSSTAQMLATLAGAIAACVVGFVIFGFGSARTRRI